MLLFLDFKDDVIYIEYVHIWKYLYLHRFFFSDFKISKVSSFYPTGKKTVSIPVPVSVPVLSNMVDRTRPTLMLMKTGKINNKDLNCGEGEWLVRQDTLLN